MHATLLHGHGSPVEFLPDGGIRTAPRSSETVPVKLAPLWWQEKGLSYTVTGYGPRIPTRYMVKWCGRWRRVYCAVYGNSGSTYIGRGESRIFVDIEQGGMIMRAEVTRIMALLGITELQAIRHIKARDELRRRRP